MWSAAAVIVLLSGAGAVLGGAQVLAADSRVTIDEGSVGDTSSWKFTPAEVSVPVGSTITWRNDGDLDHTATADNGLFDSGNLPNGKEFKFTFSAPGEFTYNCTPHPFMTGVVKVTGGAATPTTAATTPTTAPPGATTTTTARGATTTTAKADAGASTTTTAGAAGGATTTTLAPATTPTSAPDVGDVTSTSSAPEEHAEGEPGSESAASTHGSSSDPKTNGVGVALAGVLTVLLAAISIKLLTAKT
jgi:plastocyanin